MNWIGLLEKAFYEFHRRRDLASFLRGGLGETTGAHVLDFGGGTGKVSAALASSGPETFVVADPSSEALRSGPTTPRVLRVRIQATPALPFSDEVFRAVIVVDALHHVPDAIPAMVECGRCLQPGGSLHIVEFDGRARLTHIFGWLVRRQGRSCRFWVAENLVAALRKAGFETETTRVDGLRYAVRAIKPVRAVDRKAQT